MAELTGVDLPKLERFWRALGFADVDDDDLAFTHLDLEAVRLFQGMQALGAARTDTALQLARVIGSSMSRIAEAELVPGDRFAPIWIRWWQPMRSPAWPTSPYRPWHVCSSSCGGAKWRPAFSAACSCAAAAWSGAEPELAVGFADMVGFTLLSQHLGDRELADVVRRFEEISHDIVTVGGRVVKMIGDEVMYVATNAADAARIGLDLADAYSDDELLSDVRVGLASGPVLSRDGDYFGPTVNLAHRIVNIGNPGTVLMSDEFHTALEVEAPGEFTHNRCGRGSQGSGPSAIVVGRSGRPDRRRCWSRGGPPPQWALGTLVRSTPGPGGTAGCRRAPAYRNRSPEETADTEKSGARASGRWRSRRA